MNAETRYNNVVKYLGIIQTDIAKLWFLLMLILFLLSALIGLGIALNIKLVANN